MYKGYLEYIDGFGTVCEISFDDLDIYSTTTDNPSVLIITERNEDMFIIPWTRVVYLSIEKEEE